MATRSKDTTSMASKVALRLRLLQERGLSSVSVLDLYAGEGHVWKEMRKHVAVTSYMPVDIKRRQRGTLVMPAAFAARRLDLSGFDVIDIDAYGEPWRPAFAVLRRLQKRTLVFLTCGMTSFLTAASDDTLQTLGLSELSGHATDQRGRPSNLALTFHGLGPNLMRLMLYEAGRQCHIRTCYRIERRTIAYIGLDAGPLE